MAGRLVYLMGPSGSGKDTLIREAAREFGSRVRFVRRYITRPAEAGGERHRPLSEEEFTQMAADGRFVLYWESHGLLYGLGREMDDWLAEGRVVVVNGSRACLPLARALYPDLRPVLITVEPDILRARLTARGRESGRDLDERLKRGGLAVPPASDLRVIDNSGPPSVAVGAFCALLGELAGPVFSPVQENAVSLPPGC